METAPQKKSHIKVYAIIVAAILLAATIAYFPFKKLPKTTKPPVQEAQTLSIESPITAFSGAVEKKGDGYIYVRANGRQAIPQNSLRNVFITRETRIGKAIPDKRDETGYVIGSRIVNATFADIRIGAQVIVSSKNSVNISKEAAFEAESITLLEGDF